MEEQLESILFLLPETEKNTIKAFLLMQHERIERLETLYDNLKNESWSKTWNILNLKDEHLTKLANALYDRPHADLIFYNIRYHQITKHLYIHFKTTRCKTFILEWLQNIDLSLNKNDIITTDQLTYSYNWEQLWTLKTKV
jgi:hypothetical protein